MQHNCDYQTLKANSYQIPRGIMIQAIGKFVLLRGVVRKEEPKKSIILIKNPSIDYWEVVSIGEDVKVNIKIGDIALMKGFGIDVDLGDEGGKLKLVTEESIFAVNKECKAALQA